MSGRDARAPRPLTSSDVRRALGLEVAVESGPDHAVRAERVFAGVSTDSRTIDPGQLFVAIAGERFDGADFLADVAGRGVEGAIVPSDREAPDLPLEYFAVEDPVRALGQLARYARLQSAARVIGVTGSSGKTTVKEMIADALSEVHEVHRTSGNLNSQIGVPLMILGAPSDADVWVLEMGASEPGEIARLAWMAEPDHAVVTTVGPAHLEQFGDEGAVLEEKLSLVEGARPEGAAVVGELPPELPRAARRLRDDVIVAGLGAQVDYGPDAHGVAADRVWFERAGVRYEVPAGGEHHLRDAVIAAALADRMGVPGEATAAGLARYRAVGMRGALVRVGDLTIVADCYNANPESFLAAIAYCRDLFPGRRLSAFVGSMLELGAREGPAHGDVLHALVAAGFEWIAATGAFADPADRLDVGTAGWVVDPDPLAAWPAFLAGLRGDEVVLVKASRGARLERIVQRLEATFGADGEA